ncbi:MAG TPA: hypothetical protein VE081_12730 [Sporichthyaceae bacterium]|nr:hypothetical protein [Sporichthyaceae bacterium]
MTVALSALVPAVLTLLIAPYVGMVWESLAPAPTYINLGGAIYLKNQDTAEFISADLCFLFIGLLVGIVSGALAYWRYRKALPAMIGLTAAAFLAAMIARHVGVEFSPPPIAQAAPGTADGASVHAQIALQSHSLLLSWPVGVLLAYVCLIAGLERPSEPSVEALPAADEIGAGEGREMSEELPLATQQSELGS